MRFPLSHRTRTARPRSDLAPPRTLPSRKRLSGALDRFFDRDELNAAGLDFREPTLDLDGPGILDFASAVDAGKQMVSKKHTLLRGEPEGLPLYSASASSIAAKSSASNSGESRMAGRSSSARDGDKSPLGKRDALQNDFAVLDDATCYSHGCNAIPPAQRKALLYRPTPLVETPDQVSTGKMRNRLRPPTRSAWK